MEVYIAAAFSTRPDGGNLAGVVTDGAHLSRREKQNIAERLGLSETAFASPSQRGGLRLEYFTPTEEVPLCGHATIAAFSVLRQLGKWDGACTVETGAGLLRVEAQGECIFMEQNPAEFSQVLLPDRVKGCFAGWEPRPALPVQIVSTGLRDILMPVDSPERLAAMKPDFEAIKRLSQTCGVVGIHAFAPSGDGAYCRNFAPLYGIDEEAATGTSNCALACYLTRNGLGRERFLFRQGQWMGRPSQIVVELRDGVPFVGGQACVAERRELFL